ncbi:hypothetical protein ERX37_09840 [Macrococcus hajekii]|uniref:Uncharacterized protein n=1 Tax=Macrococcus hajekii TaxID=198482 RepID=A0A4R6BI06_9STAP|nr:hypothetical protein [Macrococcus hajekii]TDM01173.1 hypothetical protein ERX37_09840 [Macrococcus hajekii]GGB11949.1 hypothetical protein GCM10007190_20030 [Macrococcus hajekii]
MKGNKKIDIKWNTLYRVLNILVIILIFAQFTMERNISLYIVLTLAALFIVGLLDSIDHQRYKENKLRHLFDGIILVLYTALTML